MTVSTAGFRYDPSSAEFGDQIWDVYRTLRNDSPVYYDEKLDEYVISRFEDVRRVAQDVEQFSSVVAEANILLPMLNYIDPPRHTKLRALVSQAFSLKRVAELEDKVRLICKGLIRDVGRDESCEFHDQVAGILPSAVISDLIGVPDEHVDEFRELATIFLEIDPAQFEKPAARIYEIFSDLLSMRRVKPAGDLMTALLEATVDGEQLTDDDLLGFCFLLMTGGIDTTTNLLGSGIVLLARDPEQRALLVSDRSLWPRAIEEINRLEAPTQALWRTATTDVQMHGVTIPAGARVRLLWGAANRDERHFPDPERFNVTRPGPRHLSFGHGIHFCLGAHLTRLEARVAFEEWHASFPEYQLAAEPTRLISNVARAYKRIPLRLR